MADHSPLRILVANEPRAYREVQAAFLRLARPDASVAVVAAAEMDAAIDALHPHVVLCSALTPAVRARPLAWILLYPGAANLAVLAAGGAERTVPAVTQADILAVVEAAARRLAAHDAAPAGVLPVVPPQEAPLAPLDAALDGARRDDLGASLDAARGDTFGGALGGPLDRAWSEPLEAAPGGVLGEALGRALAHDAALACDAARQAGAPAPPQAAAVVTPAS